MSEKAIRLSEDDATAKVTIERTASGKYPVKLACTSESTTEQVSALIDRTMDGFRYLENRTMRDLEHSDVGALERPTGPAEIPDFAPMDK